LRFFSALERSEVFLADDIFVVREGEALDAEGRVVADVVAQLGVGAGQRCRLADLDRSRGNARRLLRLHADTGEREADQESRQPFVGHDHYSVLPAAFSVPA
jgi:hypothetical protein